MAEKLAELQKKGLVVSMENGAFTRVVHQDVQIQVNTHDFVYQNPFSLCATALCAMNLMTTVHKGRQANARHGERKAADHSYNYRAVLRKARGRLDDREQRDVCSIQHRR